MPGTLSCIAVEEIVPISIPISISILILWLNKNVTGTLLLLWPEMSGARIGGLERT